MKKQILLILVFASLGLSSQKLSASPLKGPARAEKINGHHWWIRSVARYNGYVKTDGGWLKNFGPIVYDTMWSTKELKATDDKYVKEAYDHPGQNIKYGQVVKKDFYFVNWLPRCQSENKNNFINYRDKILKHGTDLIPQTTITEDRVLESMIATVLLIIIIGSIFIRQHKINSCKFSIKGGIAGRHPANINDDVEHDGQKKDKWLIRSLELLNFLMLTYSGINYLHNIPNTWPFPIPDFWRLMFANFFLALIIVEISKWIRDKLRIYRSSKFTDQEGQLLRLIIANTFVISILVWSYTGDNSFPSAFSWIYTGDYYWPIGFLIAIFTLQAIITGLIRLNLEGIHLNFRGIRLNLNGIKTKIKDKLNQEMANAVKNA